MADLLKHLIEEERKRNLASQERLIRVLKSLPKGKPYIRIVKKKGKERAAYVYLSRRIPGKQYPESKYIAPEGSEIAKEVLGQIKDRERIKHELHSLEIEQKMIEKALNEYRRSR